MKELSEGWTIQKDILEKDTIYMGQLKIPKERGGLTGWIKRKNITNQFYRIIHEILSDHVNGFCISNMDEDGNINKFLIRMKKLGFPLHVETDKKITKFDKIAYNIESILSNSNLTSSEKESIKNQLKIMTNEYSEVVEEYHDFERYISEYAKIMNLK